jgi:hypothetical protein
VNWKKQFLRGVRRNYRLTIKNSAKKNKTCNAWNVRGIYALYDNFKLVYIGLAASGEGIGSRLRAHNEKPRMARRWDSFSWFGIDGFDEKGELFKYREHDVSAEVLIRSCELIGILVADPPMNRSQGKFKEAEKIIQAQIEEPIPSMTDLGDLLQRSSKN